MDISIRQLKGIGARREKLMARLGIETIPDMLQYFPREYEDHSQVIPLGDVELPTEKAVLVSGRIGTIQELRPRRGMTILKVVLADDNGSAEMVWFNQTYKKSTF